MTKIIPPAQISSGSSPFIALILYLPFGNRTSQILHLALLYARLVSPAFIIDTLITEFFCLYSPNILFPKVQPRCFPALAISTFIFKNCCSNLYDAYLQRPGHLQSEGLYMPILERHILPPGEYAPSIKCSFLSMHLLSLFTKSPSANKCILWD